jgi:hypothetical protein
MRGASWLTGVMLALVSVPARADDGRDPEGTLTFGDWTLRPSVEVRTRAEYRRGPVDLGGARYESAAVQGDAFGSAAPAVAATGPTVRDAFAFSERARLGASLGYGSVRAQVTLQDARSLGWVPEGAAENTALGATGLGAFEAYIDARSDSDESTGEGPVFEARIGRQTVRWGEGRLLGARDWWQSGLALDAVRLQLHLGDGLTDVEALAALLVSPGPITPPLAANGATSDGSGAQLFGLRNAWHLAALLHLEASALGRIVREPVPSEFARGDTLTADLRAFGDYRGVSYSAEGAYQLGRVAGYGVNRNLAAFAGAARLDWQTAIPGDVRFGLSGAYASGDASGGNGTRLKRFDPILPDVHRHHGMMDLAAWSNLLDGAATVGARPGKRFDTSARYAFLGLAEPGDRWTTSNMLPVGVAPTNTSRTLGHEVDVRIAYQPNENVSVDAGYGLMFTGAGAKNILTAAGRGAPELLHFGYVQASFRAP